MKALLLLSFLSLSTFNCYAQASIKSHYFCAYTLIESDGDEVIDTINIFLSPEKNHLIYTSDQLSQEVRTDITRISQKSGALILEGDMPSPWSPGSKFKIEIKESRAKQKIYFIVPQDTNLDPIKMKCSLVI